MGCGLRGSASSIKSKSEGSLTGLDAVFLFLRGLVGVLLVGLDSRLAENGSRYERAEAALARLNMQIPNVTGAESREADLDLTQAISDLKMYEYTHQASLSTVGNLYKNTLLNYLR